eukprot:gb/GECG01015614.1/.p1 GENE.gb/GECG01015614.1/~~gb/GECG01015614.1/.p1  ORF type:complete len:241 (+),score=11.88 gb/GECG01015614.1/:1-723(+)
MSNERLIAGGTQSSTQVSIEDDTVPTACMETTGWPNKISYAFLCLNLLDWSIFNNEAKTDWPFHLMWVARLRIPRCGNLVGGPKSMIPFMFLNVLLLLNVLCACVLAPLESKGQLRIAQLVMLPIATISSLDALFVIIYNRYKLRKLGSTSLPLVRVSTLWGDAANRFFSISINEIEQLSVLTVDQRRILAARAVRSNQTSFEIMMYQPQWMSDNVTKPCNFLGITALVQLVIIGFAIFK